MSITNVDSPEEFENELSEKLKLFMENNETFNVQGSWTGDDGVTVGVIVDYGIEDREGNYYVGHVSARYSENEDSDFDGDVAESDTFYEAQLALESALRDVFEVPHGYLYPDTTKSDIDLSSTYTIGHGMWDTHHSIDYEQTESV
jgi:hypothetical protein